MSKRKKLYEVVTEDCRTAGDKTQERVVATYTSKAKANAHADRQTRLSKAAEDDWTMFGEIYWTREVKEEPIIDGDGWVDADGTKL